MEKANKEIEKARKEKDQLESKLSKIMTELEQTNKSLGKDHSVDEEQIHSQPGRQKRNNIWTTLENSSKSTQHLQHQEL